MNFIKSYLTVYAIKLFMQTNKPKNHFYYKA